MTNQSQTAHYQEFDALHHLHPFTSHKSLRAGGVRVIVRGDGPYLWDSEGKRILEPIKGRLAETLREMREDMQSSISYAGGRELKDLKKVNYVILGGENAGEHLFM